MRKLFILLITCLFVLSCNMAVETEDEGSVTTNDSNPAVTFESTGPFENTLVKKVTYYATEDIDSEHDITLSGSLLYLFDGDETTVCDFLYESVRIDVDLNSIGGMRLKVSVVYEYKTSNEAVNTRFIQSTYCYIEPIPTNLTPIIYSPDGTTKISFIFNFDSDVEIVHLSIKEINITAIP